ncbi:GroES-like protein [Patellaria atrata CBS 101060]|uniref:GroES-like protein n=1 Tax=Patellaria atrata CBS 101060 TaxID=1346257 RepID=A0A9P4VN92_9PEZI|nr:GroES-like protein [Patellaria atrata CBS 101060]
MAESIPKKCKAAVIEKFNSPLVIKEMDVPKPASGEVLIKVHACGVCATDASIIAGHMPVGLPLIPGHEVIGRVVKLGDGETKWKIGDIVGGGWHGGHDGTCKSCSRGVFQCCSKQAINGVTRSGGYAEYTTLRSEAAVRIPDGVDLAEAAPLLCAGVTVFNGMRQLGITPASLVAVQGIGGLGHLAIQYAKKMGYRVVAISSSESKKNLSIQLGASAYVDSSKEDVAEEIQKLGGAAMVVVTAPNPEVFDSLIKACAPKGKVLLLSVAGEVKINTIPMVLKAISLCGWPSGHALDSEETISFAQNHGVKCMIEKFPLDKANDAVDHLKAGKPRFRAVLTMD